MSIEKSFQVGFNSIENKVASYLPLGYVSAAAAKVILQRREKNGGRSWLVSYHAFLRALHFRQDRICIYSVPIGQIKWKGLTAISGSASRKTERHRHSGRRGITQWLIVEGVEEKGLGVERPRRARRAYEYLLFTPCSSLWGRSLGHGNIALLVQVSP